MKRNTGHCKQGEQRPVRALFGEKKQVDEGRRMCYNHFAVAETISRTVRRSNIMQGHCLSRKEVKA